MPLIAYKGAHGANDYPLHFAFFGHLERAGLLDRYDFAIDGWHDPGYALALLRRFPQLKLAERESVPRRALLRMHRAVGRFYRPLAFLDTKFDAVCEGPGGRITEHYCPEDVFRLYPRTRRRAILFHSIERGALKNDGVRASIASAELVIARTRDSARAAEEAGANRVIASSDVVFVDAPRTHGERPGIAMALRVPNSGATTEYRAILAEIIDRLCEQEPDADWVQGEEPLGTMLRDKGIGTYAQPGTGLFHGDAMYAPFLRRRRAVVSSRLHTTLLALLHGNRNILQFHIELGTNKTQEILEEMQLRSLEVHRLGDVRWETISEFLRAPPAIPEEEATAALAWSRERVLAGMQALEEWLHSLGRRARARAPSRGEA
jgi:hypothetical protein